MAQQQAILDEFTPPPPSPVAEDFGLEVVDDELVAQQQAILTDITNKYIKAKDEGTGAAVAAKIEDAKAPGPSQAPSLAAARARSPRSRVGDAAPRQMLGLSGTPHLGSLSLIAGVY